jgi:hypothetical protein
MPTLSTEGAQESEIEDAPTPDTTSPTGMEGAAVSEVPPPPFGQSSVRAVKPAC